MTLNPHSAEALYWQAQDAIRETRNGKRKASKAIFQVERALASDPMNLQLRLGYVELLNDLDEKYRDVLLHEIATLEGVLARRLAFNPQSAWRLTPSEQARLAAIKAHFAAPEKSKKEEGISNDGKKLEVGYSFGTPGVSGNYCQTFYEKIR